MLSLLLKTLRNLIIPRTDFSFKKYRYTKLSEEEDCLNLYIHIPFCKNQCYFCPYNTVPFNKDKVPVLFSALKKEIEMLLHQNPLLGFNTVYIGGGTPTLVADEMAEFLQWLKAKVTIKGVIAIETTPDNFNYSKLKLLNDAGVNMLSIGVQSFNDKILQFLGRSYDSSNILQNIEDAAKIGFDHVNIDMIWVTAVQTFDEFDADLEKAISSKADQITAYPLFKFPHSKFGIEQSIKKVKMPALLKRRKFYRHYHNKMNENEFLRISVWGFSRKSKFKYSSVTRPNHIGIGPGAASRIKSGFYFNTFNFDAYCHKINNGEMATSLQLEMSANLQIIYDIYWRYYETEIPGELIAKMDNPVFRLGMKFFNLAGMQRKDKESFILSERGAFWVHLLQNYYILNYINKVWSISMTEAFPEKIKL